LPASILFGALWDRFGSATAFVFGAALALVAALALTVCRAPDEAAFLIPLAPK
jgi:hypothetical protein